MSLLFGDLIELEIGSLFRKDPQSPDREGWEHPEVFPPRNSRGFETTPTCDTRNSMFWLGRSYLRGRLITNSDFDIFPNHEVARVRDEIRLARTFEKSNPKIAKKGTEGKNGWV